MAECTDSPMSARVRDLIFAYERQATIVEPAETYHERPRAKSIGNALSYKLFRQPNLEFHSIIDIEKELVKIEAHLNYYEVYEKETHVAFQEQLFNVLTSIVRIDPEDQEHSIEIKKKLIQETQKLATELNTRLPYDRTLSYKVSRSYSTMARKEEAVVSTSTARSQEHRVVLTSHSSTLNGGFKSEDSLSSAKDSVDLSFKNDDSSSVELNHLEERHPSVSPPPQKNILEDIQAESRPCVSRLKKFFSFRRETKPEVRVTSASYSGITRSQSLNTKSNKYTILKRSKHEERTTKKTQESFNESDEMVGADSNSKTHFSVSQDINYLDVPDFRVESSNIIDATKGFEVGDVADIEEEHEEHEELPQNVSVSKLKNLFEINRKESTEGLGLLTKNRNELNSEFDIPFTAMNLGSYRLKRTISGSYMNFTGLLRNVDIKKNDITKSKSLSDLKAANLGHGLKETEIFEDFSKELDGDDHELVSVDMKGCKEVNNNVVTNETSSIRNTPAETQNASTHIVHKIPESTFLKKDQLEKPRLRVPMQLRTGYPSKNGSENNTENFKAEQTTVMGNTIQSTKIIETTTFGSVEQLKQTFEKVGSTSNIQNNNEDIRHILHRAIEPNAVAQNDSGEPKLKVPIQLRTGFLNERIQDESAQENVFTSSIENSNDDIKHILHRTIEPNAVAQNNSGEAKLKVPIQLRTGFLNERHQGESAQEKSSTGSIENSNDDIKHILHRTIEPNSVARNDSREPKLKVPIQLRTGFFNERHQDESAQENISTSSIKNNNEDMKNILHRTIEPSAVAQNDSEEPKLKVPVQYRIGFLNERHQEESTQENISTSSIENSNEDIEHILHRTIEPSAVAQNDSEEPKLKVPVQLRIGFLNERHQEESTQENISTTSIKNSNEAIEHIPHRTIEPSAVAQNDSEEPKLKVPIQLRTGFLNERHHEESTQENMSTTSIKNSNEAIEHILHRTIEPSAVAQNDSDEPKLKVPIQLRTGFLNERHHEESTQENICTSSIENINEDIEHILHRTIEPSAVAQNDSEEPKLKVPIQLRTGLLIERHHEESLQENISTSSIDKSNEDIKHILHRTIEPSAVAQNDSDEPKLKVPIQLRTGFLNERHHEESTQENISTSSIDESNEAIEHILHRTIEPSAVAQNDSEEPKLKVPNQLRTGFLNERHHEESTQENISTSSIDKSNEDIKHILHRTIEPSAVAQNDSEEPKLKVPIQLRTGFLNERHHEESTQENISTSSIDKSNEDIKHILHRTIEPSAVAQNDSEEPKLKVPIQLRTGFLNERHHEESTQENISTSRIENINEDIEHILHRTIEPSAVAQNDSEEPKLKVPIQLRTGFLNARHHEESTHENFDTISMENSNEDIKHTLHKIIEPTANTENNSEEPKLKVPVQLRTGFLNENRNQESAGDQSNETRTLVPDTDDSFAASGTVEKLKQTFEHVGSTTIVDELDDNVKHVLHKTIETKAFTTDVTDEPKMKVPIQLRTGFSYEKYSQKSQENSGSSSNTETTNEETKHILTRTIGPVSSMDGSEQQALKIPIQLRTGLTEESQHQQSEESSSEHITVVSQGEMRESHLQRSLSRIIHPSTSTVTSMVTGVASKDVKISTEAQNQEITPTLDITTCSNESDTTEIDEEDQALSRASIQEKTQSFVKILESPTHLSSRISSSSFGQAHQSSSTSQLSVSYSEKRSVQHSTTTQRIVTSTSSVSSQSSQNFLQVHEGASSTFGTRSKLENPDEESQVTITEVEEDFKEIDQPKVNLNVSQENIIDEILKESNSMENIEEEFEKMLDKYAM